MPAHKDLVGNWKEKFGAILGAFDPKYREVEFRPTMGQGMQQLFLDYEKKDMRVRYGPIILIPLIKFMILDHS